MAPKTQMLKGLLEGCILKIIDRKETYGYAICEDLFSYGFKDLNEGTVYPILIRLEKKKLIYSVKKASRLGPKRKYFYLTDNGKEYLKNFIKEWTEMRGIIDRILEGDRR
ncbi:MAG: PadR family transcriptional regulator [Thermosipho sp. (in: Bacteria)]|nr:PadR family transcriptional regulator [Thermosipho sp. (in: thermotogales)]